MTARPAQPAASEEIKSAVARKNDELGDVVDTLDRLALSLGDWRISLWDILIYVGVVVGVIAAAWFIGKLARRMIRRIGRLDPSQQVLSEKIVSIMVWAAAFFIGIDLLGIDLTALAVFSGAFGLAIGFGLQKTFGNLIAGIILLLDKSIKPGDVIAITNSGGQETFGQIRKIGIRAVSLVTRDQKEYLIPNENLMINQVENWSYSSRNVRIQVPVGVGYDCDLDLAEKLMLQAARSSPRILAAPPPTVWLSSFGADAVEFTIQCWIQDPEEGIGNVRSAVLKDLIKRFRDAGIGVPFPQRDLHLRQSEQLDRLIAALEGRG